jgi:hypothetical protein
MHLIDQSTASRLRKEKAGPEGPALPNGYKTF